VDKKALSELEYVINEAISMWLENRPKGEIPKKLISDHYGWWQGKFLPEQPLDGPAPALTILTSVRELAKEIEGFVDFELKEAAKAT